MWCKPVCSCQVPVMGCLSRSKVACSPTIRLPKRRRLNQGLEHNTIAKAFGDTRLTEGNWTTAYDVARSPAMAAVLKMSETLTRKRSCRNRLGSLWISGWRQRNGLPRTSAGCAPMSAVHDIGLLLARARDPKCPGCLLRFPVILQAQRALPVPLGPVGPFEPEGPADPKCP